jgi:hypothetical protein
MSDNQALHIVFGPAAATNLRQALALSGRAERIVRLDDMLNLGPINPPDPLVRVRWFRDNLGGEHFGPADWRNERDWAERIEAFWRTLTRPAGTIVI